MQDKRIQPQTKVIGLARKSLDDPDQQTNSLEIQCDMIMEFVRYHELILESIPGTADDGIIQRSGSGLSIQREDIDILISAAESGLLSARTIVVTNFDRICRQTLFDAITSLIKPLSELGFKFLFCNYPLIVDPSDTNDQDLLMNWAKASYIYVESLANNVCRVFWSRAKDMKTPIAPAFGFEVRTDRVKRRSGRSEIVDWHIVPNTHELKALRKAGMMYADGIAKTEICRYLNEDVGVKTSNLRNTRGGNPWQIRSLERTLINSCYNGTYEKCKTKNGQIKSVGEMGVAQQYSKYKKAGTPGQYKSRIEPNEHSIVIRMEKQEDHEKTKELSNGLHSKILEPLKIFDDDTFDKILSRYKERGRNSFRQLRTWSLSGVCKCGTCGGPMRGRTRNKGPRQGSHFYACEMARLYSGTCGGLKGVDEQVLIENIMGLYYGVCTVHPDEVLVKVNETKKQMVASEEKLRAMKDLVRAEEFEQYVFGRDGGNSSTYQRAEQDVLARRTAIEKMDDDKDFEINNYDGDKYSLTSELVSLGIDDWVTLFTLAKIKKTEFEKQYTDGNFELTKDLVDDILEDVVIYFDGTPYKTGTRKNLKYRPAYAEVRFRFGVTSYIVFDWQCPTTQAHIEAMNERMRLYSENDEPLIVLRRDAADGALHFDGLVRGEGTENDALHRWNDSNCGEDPEPADFKRTKAQKLNEAALAATKSLQDAEVRLD